MMTGMWVLGRSLTRGSVVRFGIQLLSLLTIVDHPESRS